MTLTMLPNGRQTLLTETLPCHLLATERLMNRQKAVSIVLDVRPFHLFAKKPFEFVSPVTDTASQTEWDLYNQIQKATFRLADFILTCDGILLINPDWVTGSTIGLPITMLKIAQIFSGETDSKMTYKISGEIAECRSLKRVKLSADTIAILTRSEYRFLNNMNVLQPKQIKLFKFTIKLEKSSLYDIKDPLKAKVGGNSANYVNPY